jgi:ribose 1,5-bisphosphokinase
MTARYALYFAPEPASDWARFGAGWLGRCADSGRDLPRPRLEGVAAATFASLTREPRRYGFHATLKPPFRLARGATLAALMQALERFCARQRSLRLPPLEVAHLDGFLAITPAAPEPRIDALAAACVRGLDRFRAPASAAELARRRARALSAREEQLLRRWGYPYVLDRFRFHFSLTGSLAGVPAPAVAAVRRAAQTALETLSGAPLALDAVCLFEEPAPGAPLRVLCRVPFRHRGRLIYVVGPSGAGKDSLLAWVRTHLAGDAGVRLAQRCITRPAAAGGEAHLALTEAQFEAALGRGDFALHWQANGHRYGIPREIERWLAGGQTVVVNGSRAHLPAALAKFPQLEAVHVTAPPEQLRLRLKRRGREDARAARRRLLRGAALAGAERAAALRLVNDGPLEAAGALLAAFVRGTGGALR